jgi:hypothetical protein
MNRQLGRPNLAFADLLGWSELVSADFLFLLLCFL